MSNKKYTVNRRVDHNGELFEEGASIELDEKLAAPLLAAGAIADAKKAAPEKTDSKTDEKTDSKTDEKTDSKADK